MGGCWLTGVALSCPRRVPVIDFIQHLLYLGTPKAFNKAVSECDADGDSSGKHCQHGGAAARVRLHGSSHSHCPRFQTLQRTGWPGHHPLPVCFHLPVCFQYPVQTRHQKKTRRTGVIGRSAWLQTIHFFKSSFPCWFKGEIRHGGPVHSEVLRSAFLIIY